MPFSLLQHIETGFAPTNYLSLLLSQGLGGGGMGSGQGGGISSNVLRGLLMPTVDFNHGLGHALATGIKAGSMARIADGWDTNGLSAAAPLLGALWGLI